MIPAEKIKWIIENMNLYNWELCENIIGGYFLRYDKNIEYEYLLDSDEDLLVWKCFLQDVIETINQEDLDYCIEVCSCVTIVNSEDGSDYEILKNYRMTEAKEKAILYIVDKIREKS